MMKHQDSHPSGIDGPPQQQSTEKKLKYLQTHLIPQLLQHCNEIAADPNFTTIALEREMDPKTLAFIFEINTRWNTYLTSPETQEIAILAPEHILETFRQRVNLFFGHKEIKPIIQNTDQTFLHFVQDQQQILTNFQPDLWLQTIQGRIGAIEAMELEIKNIPVGFLTGAAVKKRIAGKLHLLNNFRRFLQQEQTKIMTELQTLTAHQEKQWGSAREAYLKATYALSDEAGKNAGLNDTIIGLKHDLDESRLEMDASRLNQSIATEPPPPSYQRAPVGHSTFRKDAPPFIEAMENGQRTRIFNSEYYTPLLDQYLYGSKQAFLQKVIQCMKDHTDNAAMYKSAEYLAFLTCRYNDNKNVPAVIDTFTAQMRETAALAALTPTLTSWKTEYQKDNCGQPMSWPKRNPAPILFFRQAFSAKGLFPEKNDLISKYFESVQHKNSTRPRGNPEDIEAEILQEALLVSTQTLRVAQ